MNWCVDENILETIAYFAYIGALSMENVLWLIAIWLEFAHLLAKA